MKHTTKNTNAPKKTATATRTPHLAIVTPDTNRRPRDAFDDRADRERAAFAARKAAVARSAQQASDEAPAWRRSDDGPDGVLTLRTLIAQAVAGREDHSVDAFEHGALCLLAADLATLYAASHHDEEDMGLSHDALRLALWHLAQRAGALVELSRRFDGAEKAVQA